MNLIAPKTVVKQKKSPKASEAQEAMIDYTSKWSGSLTPIDIEILMDKYASKQLAEKAKSRVKEEEPTRKSSRVRTSTVTGGNFYSLVGMLGESTYCEGGNYNDDADVLMMLMNDQSGLKGCKRKKKAQQKKSESE